MTLQNKLLALLALPLLIVGILVSVVAWNLIEEREASIRTKNLTDMAVIMGDFIHEVHKERDMSAGLIGSMGTYFAEELQTQWGAVDQKRAQLINHISTLPQGHLSPDIISEISFLNQQLDSIQGYRSQTTENRILITDAERYYSGINETLLGILSSLSSSPHNAEITTQLRSYETFLQAKEQLGIKHSMVSAAFGEGQFSPEVLERFSHVEIAEDVYFNTFLNHASSTHATLYRNTLQEDAFIEADRLLSIAHARIKSGGFNVDPTYWFAVDTQKIELLKSIESHLAGDVLTSVEFTIAHTQRSLLLWSLLISIGFISTGMLGFRIIKAFLSPIHQLQEAASEIAQGQHDVFIEMPLKNELGGLVFIFNTMADTIRHSMEALEHEKGIAEAARNEALRLQAATEKSRKELHESVEIMLQAIDHFSKGDLTVELPSHSNEEIHLLFSGYNAALCQVRELIYDLKSLIRQATGVAVTVSELSEMIAQEVQNQSDESQQVAHSSEEMASSITYNAVLANSTAEMTNESGEAAQQGIQIVDKTIGNMKYIAESVNRCVEVIERLGDSSQEISNVALVIQEIADQTNLLSLNAAIEAARAGESGRGFAVVADEVRKLAERTKDSTIQIASLIDAVQTETMEAVDVMREGQRYVHEGIELADKAHTALQDIEESINTMMGVVAQVAASTDQEAETSRHISSLIANISEHAQYANSQVKEITATLSELQGLATKVNGAVDIFNAGDRRATESPILLEKAVAVQSGT